MWHGYIGLENLNLNASQKAALIAAIKSLGPSCQPCHLNHWRTRLDDEAVLFEALFDNNSVGIQAFKNRLGTIFGVDPATINHTAVTQSFAGGTTPVVTFSLGGMDYIRLALFGGIGTGWWDSGDECRGYLALYRGEWENET